MHTNINESQTEPTMSLFIYIFTENGNVFVCEFIQIGHDH